jgi:enoyl-[acyl-carrier protein] reductase I
MSLHKTGSQIIPDATSVADLEILVDKAVEALGGKIDFVLHSIGMSVNVRKGNHYTSQNYDYTEKGWNVSFLSTGDAGIV